MSNADPQLEHVDPAHPVAPDAYIRVLNCKSNYVNIGWMVSKRWREEVLYRRSKRQ